MILRALGPPATLRRAGKHYSSKASRLIPAALLILGLFALFGCATPVAHAAPPENSDGRYSEWFRSLKQPGTENSCCDLSDCRSVRVRVGAEGYEALISKPDFPIEFPTWVAIPADKILQGKDNPLGQAVVCWRPHPGVICFVQGAGS